MASGQHGWCDHPPPIGRVCTTMWCDLHHPTGLTWGNLTLTLNLNYQADLDGLTRQVSQSLVNGIIVTLWARPCSFLTLSHQDFTQCFLGTFSSYFCDKHPTRWLFLRLHLWSIMEHQRWHSRYLILINITPPMCTWYSSSSSRVVRYSPTWLMSTPSNQWQYY